MKLDKVSTVVVIAVIFVTTSFLLYRNRSHKTEPVVEAHNVLQSETVGRVNLVTKTTSGEKPPAVVVAANLSACGKFLSAQSGSHFNETVKTILQHVSGKETLELTEYQLVTSDQRELIVQHTPDEETKNKIRVLRVAADGFPDRIRNFPRSEGPVEDQLQGALSLGVLKNKIEKYSAADASGSVLKIEKSQNQIVRISYSQGRNQLLCEEAQCTCQSF